MVAKVSTSVGVNRSGIDAAMRAAGQQWGDRVGRRVVTAAKERCPVDEGRLKTSIEYTTKVTNERVTVTVGSPLPYAVYVHEGTGVHGPKGVPIVPKTRQFMKFRYDGKAAVGTTPVEKRGWVFAKSVQGQKPNPFLVNALRDVFPNARQNQ